jgi:undecaprenyl pyrophosphate synthase
LFRFSIIKAMKKGKNPALPPGTKIPQHVAITMDGNRRATGAGQENKA